MRFVKEMFAIIGVFVVVAFIAYWVVLLAGGFLLCGTSLFNNCNVLQ